MKNSTKKSRAENAARPFVLTRRRDTISTGLTGRVRVLYALGGVVEETPLVARVAVERGHAVYL